MNVGSASGDADRVNTNLTLGSAVADGRGNVALSVGYTEVDPLNQDQRPYGVTALSSTTGLPQGSPTAVPLVINNVLPGFQINPGTGTFVPLYQDYNFNPDNYYQTGLNRYQITALGDFDVTERVTVYSDLLFDAQLRGIVGGVQRLVLQQFHDADRQPVHPGRGAGAVVRGGHADADSDCELRRRQRYADHAEPRPPLHGVRSAPYRQQEHDVPVHRGCYGRHRWKLERRPADFSAR